MRVRCKQEMRSSLAARRDVKVHFLRLVRGMSHSLPSKGKSAIRALLPSVNGEGTTLEKTLNHLREALKAIENL
jgi:hypothetical protein